MKQYSDDPKFSDRHSASNSVDPDQTAPRGLTKIGKQSVLVWRYHTMVEPLILNFRGFIVKLVGV